MRYELFAVLTVILCLVLLGMEYLWLYVLAGKQEDYTEKYSTANIKIKKMIESAMYCPTATARRGEIDALKNFAKDDIIILEMICDEIIRLQKIDKEDDSLGEKKESLDLIFNQIDPVEVYGGILKNGDMYDKQFACRKLADIGTQVYKEDIRELMSGKRRDLSYSAAMALAKLGDVSFVSQFILKIQDDKAYSYRVIMELISIFEGDKEELASMIFEKCNDYMKATVIKSIAPYKLEKFEPMFLEGIRSKNLSMKIACVKALGSLEKEENEHTLLVASKDNDWVVRSAAVKGLQKLKTPEAIAGVKEATKDREWWVRQAAASALLKMDVSIKDIEDIMRGYDKYASDAVKYSLYRAVDMNDGQD